MDQPLISVIIPVYNEEDRIARAIDSIRSQTYQNLEIIVVDDGSTDKSAEAVKELCTQDSRVTYHAVPASNERRTNWRGYDINAGYRARARGFSLAKGEWVTTQDADDASLLNRIEVQYSYAKKLGAKMVTVQWMQLTPHRLGKSLDMSTIQTQGNDGSLLISADEISSLARKNRGVLMREPFHQLIPFPIKWFPYWRKLFYRDTEPYPGADNCMLFHRSVLDDGITFRHRNKRTWGTPAGRGSGRDFAYRVALTYGNCWSIRVPLYLWDVGSDNSEFSGFNTFLI